MRRQSHDKGGEEGVPVGGVARLTIFLFPSEIAFYAEQRSTHRQVLTLYNPYTISLSFKMWCTAPSLYRLVEAEGSVQAKSCVDLVVRHLDVFPRNWGRMEERAGGQVGRSGWSLKAAERKRTKEEASRGLRPIGLLYPLCPHACCLPSQLCAVHLSGLCVCVAMLCVTVLMLPLHTDSSSVVPCWLHVSTIQKLVCAYTLGLVTMVFLQ